MLRRRLIVLCPLLALAGCMPAPGTSTTPAEGAEMPASIVEPYLKLHDALAQDSVEGVRQNAGALATAATALGSPAMKIDTAALSLASATELNDARSKFATLSDAMVAYQTGLKLALPDGVRVAVCPMLHKPWMQRGDAIANPYYGSAMPTCGDFQ
jgi:Protein of unknown function (DUF3347)